MKVKLDENLPLQIALDLRARTHDVQTVGEEGLSGLPDADVWQATQREGRILITQDLDFSDARANELFDGEDMGVWAGCFVVVTERKIRVRKPGSTQN